VLGKLLIQAHSYLNKFTKLLLASDQKEVGTWYFSGHQNTSKQLNLLHILASVSFFCEQPSSKVVEEDSNN